MRVVRKPVSVVPTGHMWRDPIPRFAPVVNPRYRWFATEGRPEDPAAKKRFVQWFNLYLEADRMHLAARNDPNRTPA